MGPQAARDATLPGDPATLADHVWLEIRFAGQQSLREMSSTLAAVDRLWRYACWAVDYDLAIRTNQAEAFSGRPEPLRPLRVESNSFDLLLVPEVAIPTAVLSLTAVGIAIKQVGSLAEGIRALPARWLQGVAKSERAKAEVARARADRILAERELRNLRGPRREFLKQDPSEAIPTLADLVERNDRALAAAQEGSEADATTGSFENRAASMEPLGWLAGAEAVRRVYQPTAEPTLWTPTLSLSLGDGIFKHQELLGLQYPARLSDADRPGIDTGPARA